MNRALIRGYFLLFGLQVLPSKACQVPSNVDTPPKQRQQLPTPEMIVLTRKEQRFRAEVKLTYANKMCLDFMEF